MSGFKITQFAKGEIGVTEEPADSNITKYGSWANYNGVPWCGLFVSYCYEKAGFPLPKIGFAFHGFAGCQTAYKHFLNEKEIVTHPQEGDIVLFDWNGDRRYDHTGIFSKWVDESKGLFECIEGNTSLSNDSNGGKVMIRNRYKTVAVFIHPKVLG